MGLDKQPQHHLTGPHRQEDQELLDEMEANSAKESELEPAKAKKTDHSAPVRKAASTLKQTPPASPDDLVKPPTRK